MSSESRNDGPEGSSDAAPGAADNDPFGGVVPYVPPIGVLRKLGMTILRNPLPEPPYMQIVGALEYHAGSAACAGAPAGSRRMA